MTTSPDWRFVVSNPAHFLAFGFGSGLAKVGPGTWGSLVAIPLHLLLMPLPFLAYLLLVAGMFLAGIRICDVTGRALGVEDYGGIVWDEIVAMLLVLAFVPKTWGWIVAAFIAFRIFDIWKPFPIRWFDRSVHGGLGVMLDDLLAAGYALILLWGIRWWLMI